MIHFTTPKHHWNYYFAIQSDLEKNSSYIEFCSDNLGVYSIELAHILLSASSEVDVVMKQLCAIVELAGTFENINHYKAAITAHIPDLINEEVSIPRYGLTHKPWENWNGATNPEWSSSYNIFNNLRGFFFWSSRGGYFSHFGSR